MAKEVKLNVGRKPIVIPRKNIEGFLRIFSDQSLLNLQGAKFSYFIEKNHSLIGDELQRQRKFNDKLLMKRGELSKTYIKKEKELLEKHSSEGPNGEPREKDGYWNISKEDMVKFEKEKAEAIKTSPTMKKDVKNIEIYNDAMNKYMDEDITLDFRTISEEDLPNQLNGNQRIQIRDFIREEK